MLTQLIVAVLGVSFLIGAIAMWLWKKDSPQWKAFPIAYNFFPAVTSILLVFFMSSRWSLGDFSFVKFDAFYLLLGLMIPILFFAFNLFVHLRASSYKLKQNVEWKKLLPSLPLILLFLIVMVSGEEIGWRGFLQTPLIEKFGSVVGIILLGLIWGIWHAPVALRGHNLSSHFWAEAFVLYPFACVAYSFPLAYLTIQSGSIWPALVFHATNNTLGSIGSEFVEKANTKMEVLIHLATSTILVIPFVFLLWS